MNSCKIFSTEYSRHYRKKKISPAKIILQRDLFAERIEKGEIDPRTASIPTQLDEAAEQLLYKHILDNLQSVCHVSYKNPWISHDEKQDKNADAETKEKDLQNELIAYIQGLYFNPHEEKILAPPATVKRSSLAAVSFHLNWVKRRETLERWYTKKTLRYLHTIGFLSAVAGFVSLIWYIFVQFYYNMPITPYEESVLITAICALYCGFWGVLLLCYSQEYEQIITEAPILTENNA
ncbi:PREDICTED: uncharacterized protein LOC108570399 [Habropoda laboriosa]|uniref:uncharacterized protein LOC108570399 n=1 Tax=Habropoda laboriosa TaxID=597456 RepID=UPI00083D13C1|nr:PREDICTED: uncharacterized protein LOC108570399 [Habropoda laboriosa]